MIMNFLCRRCLNSYRSDNMLMLHRPKFEIYDRSTIRTLTESCLHWKKQFHKNPLRLRIYADFEADNEVDISSIDNKTTNIYKQKPMLNGYNILSELDDVLQSGYYESLLGCDIVEWFVNELVNL